MPLSGWRDMMAWTKTDSQLLLRHARFFFLIAPLVGSSLIAWSWLGMYWRDLHRNGPGEPLMEGAAADSTSPAPPGEALRALLLWLPVRAPIAQPVVVPPTPPRVPFAPQ